MEAAPAQASVVPTRSSFRCAVVPKVSSYAVNRGGSYFGSSAANTGSFTAYFGDTSTGTYGPSLWGFRCAYTP